jgi:hypothetical protein
MIERIHRNFDSQNIFAPPKKKRSSFAIISGILILGAVLKFSTFRVCQKLYHKIKIFLDAL